MRPCSRSRFRRSSTKRSKQFPTRRARSRPGLRDALARRDAKGPPEPEKKTPPPVRQARPPRARRTRKVVIHRGRLPVPFCKVGSKTPSRRSVQELRRQGEVRLARQSPPDARERAARRQFARETLKQKGPDGFWKAHDKMMANQQKLARGTSRSYAKGDRPRRRQAQGRARQPRAQGGDGRGRQGWYRHRHQRHARVPSSAATASPARSRTRSSS